MGTERGRAGRDGTSIGDALFPRVRQRVLAVLFGNPDRSFYANEIITRAGSGTGAVQRELARLEGAGLLHAKWVGKQKHFQANRDAPVFAELRGLVLKTSGLADQLQAALAPFAGAVTAAFVYGSVATQQDSAESDVDLMVLSDRLTYADLFSAMEEVSSRIGRRINPTVYTRAELARRIRKGNAFVRRVLERPKIWLLGSERDLPT